MLTMTKREIRVKIRKARETSNNNDVENAISILEMILDDNIVVIYTKGKEN